jgi:hypothetical protein
VKRISLLGAVALVALVAALPALADQGGSVKGVITALSGTGISVKDSHRTVTCAVRTASPSLTGYAVGDRVQAQCRGARRHPVLARIRHLDVTASGHGTGSGDPGATDPGTTDPSRGDPGADPGPSNAEPVKFGGTITALSPSSITLHDGDRDLTCTIGDASPSTSALKVGDHARVICQNGVLVSLGFVPTSGPQPGQPPHPEPQPLPKPVAAGDPPPVPAPPRGPVAGTR